MAHDHSHADHDHSHVAVAGNAAFATAVVLNVGFVVAEVAYGLAANSLALLSDAGHNLTDVFGLLIAWGAMHLGKSMPTKRRTYGLRRSSILVALINAVVLLIVVGGIAWEAIGRFVRPEAVDAGIVTWVAAVGILVNGVSAGLFMAARKHDLNIKGAFLHMAGDALVSLGVVLTGLAILATGWDWLDPVVSIAVSAVIVWGTWGLLTESLNLAMDAVPAGIDAHKVEAYLAVQPGVTSVHDLHIWGMSTTEVALTSHLVMSRPPADDNFLAAICDELRSRFGIGHVTIQIEHGTAVCRQAPDNVV